jgi:VCBS repeat-containing protein
LPIVGGISAGSVTEDADPDVNGLLETSELLSIVDPDSGESSFRAERIVGTYGVLEIDDTGKWRYTADNNQGSIQQLDAGETIRDVLIVTTADGTAQNVTVTINGAEDAPVIEGTANGTVAEDGTLTARGALHISDIDNNDSPYFPDQVPTPGDNGYGEFSFTAGAWTYTLNNADPEVQGLGRDGTLNDTHTFRASDGSTRSVTITITGAEEVEPSTDGGSDGPDDGESVAEYVSAAIRDALTGSRLVEDRAGEIEESSELADATETVGQSKSEAAEETEVLAESDAEESSAMAEAVLVELEQVHEGGGGAPRPVSGFLLESVLADADSRSGRDNHRLIAQRPVPEPFLDLANLDIAPYEPQRAGYTDQTSILDNDAFVASLEALDKEFEEAFDKQESRSQLKAEALVGVTLSLSAGFVSWVLRAGSLFASLMSVLPLWRQFDPLPILGATAVVRRKAHEAKGDGERESESGAVESIFDQERPG